MPTSSTSSQIPTQTTVYLPTILLDETNYPAWLFRLEAFLKGQNLYGYVDGSIPRPSQFVLSSTGENVISREYEAWKTQDQSVVNMLGQTLSPIAINCAVGSRSSHELWKNLKLKFAASNRQNIVQLKTNLQNVKKGSDTIETYLDRIKAARDALETVGVFLDDEDIVVTVLRGLPSEFAAIKTVIRAQYVSSSLPELKSLLQAAEIDIELETQGSSMPLTAMVAKGSSPTVPSTSGSSSPTSSHSFGSSSHSTSLNTNGASSSNTSAQAPYFPIPAMPYGFGPLASYPLFDPSFPMAGFYAGHGNGRNNSYQQGNFTQGNRSNNYPRRNFDNNNNGGNFGNNNSNGGNNFGYHRNNNSGGNLFTCQLCGKVGHGAKTCRTLSNFQQGNTSNNICCQYCGKDNHTADRCFFLIGFPNQQQQHQPNQASAMLAAASYAPQYWLADTGATNHMTSDPQVLSNLTPVSNADSVQVGNGAQLPVTHFGQGIGQNSVQRTE